MSEDTKTTRNENKPSDNSGRSDNRSNDRNNDSRQNNRRSSGRRGGKRNFYKKKECKLCKMDDKDINYKNIDLVRKFTTEKGKIVPRRMSGNCAKCQRKIKRAIKRARNAAFIPFTKK